MPDIVDIKNVSSYLKPVAAFASTVLSASLANGSTLTGITFNRLTTQGLFRSADVVTLVRSSGSSKYKQTVTLRVQDSANGSSFTPYGSASKSPMTFGSTSATAKQKIKSAAGVGIDLSNAREYVRVNAVLAWSGTNKSTPGNVSGVIVLGGSDFNT